MNYIVFDLEWNQSPAGKRYSNKRLPFEIIEIGAVKLNSGFKEVGRFSELVKPRVYKNINHITEKLVHVEMSDLENARSFREVMEDFMAFCGKDYIFCTWGNLDLIELQRNMKFFHVSPLSNGPICFLDVQKLFSLQFEGKKKQHTLEYAVDFCKIQKDIAFHRAFSDAYYTARVLSKIKRKYRKLYSYDTYRLPATKADEIKVNFDYYSKFISRGYETKIEALNDEDVSFCGCYLCKRKTEEIIPWFSLNSKHYYEVSKCKRHGFVKGKNRIRKSESGQIYVIKTMKRIDESAMIEIREKYEKSKVCGVQIEEKTSEENEAVENG